MKKLVVVFVLAGLSIGLGFSDKGLILPGAYGDFSFLGIQAGHVYIFTGKEFHVFDLKDGKPLKTFGKIGQGPGEYGGLFAFPFYGPAGIVLMEMMKSNLYSLDGTFIKMIRPGSGFNKILPIGSHYVRMSSPVIAGADDRDATVEIVDEAQNLIREIFRRDLPHQQAGIARIDRAAVEIDIVVDAKKIYMGNPESDISISIFNEQGELVRTVKQDVEILDKTPAVNETYQAAGKTFAFKSKASQSAFRFFQVENGLIYVFTHQVKDDKSKLIVLNEEGREVASAWVTRAPRMNQCIYEKRYYYVLYDENIDELVLHAEPIF